MYLCINISLHVCRCSHLPAAPEHRQRQGTRRRWRPGRGRALKLTRSLAAAPIPSSDGRRAGEPAIADGQRGCSVGPRRRSDGGCPSPPVGGERSWLLRLLPTRLGRPTAVAQGRRRCDCARPTGHLSESGRVAGLTANSWAGTAWNFALLGLKFPVELCDQPS